MIRAKYWAVVPAAGQGRRFGGPVPKQYLEIAGVSVLEHTLRRLAETKLLEAVAVVTSAEDEWWSSVRERLNLPIVDARGGKERSDSVLSGLRSLHAAEPMDWVLVHDAARPCVRPGDVVRMAQALEGDTVGGLLAAPVRDTMKRADGEGRVGETVSREALWAAFTPQMFRYGLLVNALECCVERGMTITDEAQAVESAGFAPRLFEGAADNIKITHANDLALAAQYLAADAHRPVL